MKKQTYLLILYITCLAFGAFAQGAQEGKSDAEQAGAIKRLEYIIQKTADPKTGRIPKERLIEAKSMMMQKFSQKAQTQSAIPGVSWTERGPKNVGGRTRAILFDPNDATNKRVFAGGVGGGLWRNDDITTGSNWVAVDNFMANLAISFLTYDPTNTLILYASTGEGYYNSDAIAGAGIFKSTDGGTTWSQLSSTTSFGNTQRIEVNASGHIFAATSSGLYKSTDQGATWTRIRTGYHNDIEIANDGAIYITTGNVFTSSGIYKSSDGGSTWTTITPTTGYRTEIALDKTPGSGTGSSQVIYALSQSSSYNIGYFKKSTDGGTTWSDLPILTLSGTPFYSGQTFAATQAWYNLYLIVHPTNPNIVFADGIWAVRSTDGGASWALVSSGYNYHADNHIIAFRPGSPNEMVFGNDGGVYYSSNAGNSSTTASSISMSNRSSNYNVTQMISVAQKNVSGDPFVMGGSQDNGTNMVTTAGLSNQISDPVGGDGVMTFVDQDEPNIVITSYVYNNYYQLNGSGGYIRQILSNSSTGSFYNPADYDSQNNTLYSYRSTSSFFRLSGINASSAPTNTTVTVSPTLDASMSVIRVAKTANTLFVGTSGGKLYRLTNINTATATSTQIGSFSGNVSCVEIGTSDNELIVTMSSYGVVSVYYTKDGGTNWINKDVTTTYGLPDIPVHWALCNPNSTKQVLLGTELGVWSTDDITASNPAWEPTSLGLANVSVWMLRHRTADQQVAVGTHGRGLYTGFPFLCSASISGTSTYCSGQTISLTASAGSSYTWSGPNSFSSTNATISINNSAVSNGGIYTVSVVVTGCTATVTTSVSVAVYNMPTAAIAGTTSYCTGQSISLTASGGSNYSWAGPNAFSAATATIGISNANTNNGGVYTVTASNNSCTATATANVTVNTTPTAAIAGTTSYCVGETIGLTASGGSSYTWAGPVSRRRRQLSASAMPIPTMEGFIPSP
ncbi:MAG: hypothetical protein U0Y10_23195 [Spirosomataceae bacterium]